MANVRDGNFFVEPADVQDALSEMLGLSYRLPAAHDALRANACASHTHVPGTHNCKLDSLTDECMTCPGSRRHVWCIMQRQVYACTQCII